MKKFWRWFESYSAPSIPFPVELLTDAEAQERFKSVSQFILEYQKQFFESFRFSLNVWVVLNSGAAIALAQKILMQKSTSLCSLLCFFAFALGALLPALGLVDLSCLAKVIATTSMNFTANKAQTYISFIKDTKNQFESAYTRLRFIMFASYAFFYVTICFIILETAGVLQ